MREGERVEGIAGDKYVENGFVESFRLLLNPGDKKTWEHRLLIDIPVHELRIPAVGLSVNDDVYVKAIEDLGATKKGFHGLALEVANVTTGKVYECKSDPRDTLTAVIPSSEPGQDEFGWLFNSF